MLAANLLHQLDKPTGGTTKVPSVFRDLDLQVAGRPMALSAIETAAHLVGKLATKLLHPRPKGHGGRTAICDV